MNRYFDSHFNKDIVTIYPGEFFVTTGEELISTVLGSCVSIAIFDKKMCFGGMNHFILAKDSKLANDTGLAGRFGEYAVELLLNDMVKHGSKRENWVAKIFGGSNVFDSPNEEQNKVGDNNVRFTYEYLSRENIPVMASDTGGIDPRKIFFDPKSSKIWLKRIKNNIHAKASLLSTEMNYIKSVEKKKTADIVWF